MTARTATLAGGAVLAGAVALLALAGPLLAPHDPDAPVGAPFAPDGVLGTDALGRDVLSRLLHGGSAVVGLSLAALVAAEAVGIAIGLACAWWRGPLAGLALRGVDLLLAVPPLLVLAALAAGLGGGSLMLVGATVLALVPSLVRLVYVAASGLVAQPWIEAALLAGERPQALLRRELLPNLAGPLAADAGVRLLGAVFLVSSAAFLGFGPAPPAADWGLMIAENVEGIEDQPLAVLAPAALIAAWAIGLNLVGDELARRAIGR